MSQTASNGRSREIRIGLVMYGGVSLAIYMNGVASELFRAVRGRGVYKLFKALTDSDVVVDVVSGASAGGINGMFLAFALCNEREFSECAALWRDRGGIADLLRDPSSPAESQTSLLESEGYYERELASAFDKMWRNRIDAKPRNEAPSRVNELDLFVAGTDFNGRISTAVDSAAHLIEVKDYRTQFLLKHRDGRKAQLDPRADALGTDGAGGVPLRNPGQGEPIPQAGLETFATLARITSCFPGAFASVSIQVPVPAEPPAPDFSFAGKLGVWGALEPGPYHFLDGGILDNKPFTSTIQAIFYRMANRPVQRHLLYVEPDPERFQGSARRVPTFLSSALDSLTRLPSYESIAADLQSIAQHNDSIERYKRTCSELRNRIMAGPRVPESSRPTGKGPGGQVQPGEARAIYQRACLQELANLATERFLNVEPGDRMTQAAKDRMTALRHAIDDAIAQAQSATVGEESALDVLLARYDVEFRLRRLMHLTYVLMPSPPESPRKRRQHAGENVTSVLTPGDMLGPMACKKALTEIGQRVALLEIVRAKLLRAVEQNAIDINAREPEDVWPSLLRRLDAVLDAESPPEPLSAAFSGEGLGNAQLVAFAAELDRRAAAHAPLPSGAVQSLLALSDAAERALMQRLGAEAGPEGQEASSALEREYDRFEALDQVLFPIQFVADLHEQDIIRTVRVSPLDAQRGCSAGKFSDKVTGETLAHFGAFLKRSWRSNDILYGRLDGACQLLETLLNQSWLRTSLARPQQRRNALSALGLAPEEQEAAVSRGPALRRWLVDQDIFPHAGKAAVDGVADALSALLDPHLSADEFEARIDDESHSKLLDALVQATHFSILQEEYPQLIADSIDEQLGWRTVRTKAPASELAMHEEPVAGAASSGPSKPRSRFAPETRSFDTALDGLAIEAAAFQFARDALDKKLDSETLHRLLKKHPVGGEEIQGDIPPSVLLELTARSLLILRNCIINSFGPERASAIRGNRFYRVLVDWPLRALHALSLLIRERPTHGGVAIGLLCYFMLALVMVVAFFGSLWELQGWRGYVAWVVFAGVPLLSLAAAAALVTANEYSWKGVLIAQQRQAKVLLGGVLKATLAVLALSVAYVVYAYSTAFASRVLEPVLCRVDVFPRSCYDSGSFVVLVAAAATSFGVGWFVSRRSSSATEGALTKSKVQKNDPNDRQGPTSSARGGMPLPTAAE
jgi:patatin-related protein